MSKKKELQEMSEHEIGIIDNLRHRNLILRRCLKMIVSEQPVSPDLLAEKALEEEARLADGR